jgi:hypothetical protein
VLHTRPAQAIEINGGVLGVRTVCATGGKRRFRRVLVDVALDVDAAVYGLAFLVRIVAVSVGTHGRRGEVAFRPVKVDDLAPAMRGLDGRVEVVALFAVARFGSSVFAFVVDLGGLSEWRVAVYEVGGNGLWSEGRGVHGGEPLARNTRGGMSVRCN